MKKRIGTSIVAALTLALLFSACGLARRNASAAGSGGDGQAAAGGSGAAGGAAASPADQLNLRIVPAGEDSALPDPSSDLKAPRQDDEATIDGDEISFERNILLSDPDRPGTGKPLFLVWDEKALGAPIVAATADHRVVDGSNREQGAVRSVDAHLDSRTHRWYLPMSEIFQGGEADADPSVRHLVTLDLLQEGGKRVEIKVSFRAKGPLPEVPHRLLDLAVGSDPAAYVARLEQEGLQFAAIELSNPVNRPFVLWVRASEAETPRTVVGALHQFFTQQDAEHAPVGPQSAYSTSAASWGTSRIGVERSGAAPSSSSLASGEWKAIPFAARERLVVRLYADPAAGTPHCSLPGATQTSFDWVEGWNCTLGPNALQRCIRDLHNGLEPDTWALTGVQSSGNWNLEVRVADHLATPDEALGSAPGDPVSRRESFRIVLSQAVGGPWQAGGLPGPGTPAFACQGVF